MRVYLCGLLCAGSLLVGLPGALRAAEAVSPALAAHLADEVPYWLNEPRLFRLLRDNNARNGGLDDAALAGLERRWQAELDAGAGEIGDRLGSRFASKYFAEVVLRVGRVYGQILALDRRGIVVAASELPERYVYADDAALQDLLAEVGDGAVDDAADDPADAAVAGESVAEDSGGAQEEFRPWRLGEGGGRYTRVFYNIADPDSGERLGTLLLDVDVAALDKAGSMRAGERAPHVPVLRMKAAVSAP